MFFWLTDSGQPYPWIETLFPFYFSQHCSYIKCDRKWILCYLGWVFVVWHGMLHFLDWNVRTKLALIAWNKFKIKTAPEELQNTCTKLTVLKKLCPTILILYSSIFWKTFKGKVFMHMSIVLCIVLEHKLNIFEGLSFASYWAVEFFRQDTGKIRLMSFFSKNLGILACKVGYSWLPRHFLFVLQCWWHLPRDLESDKIHIINWITLLKCTCTAMKPQLTTLSYWKVIVIAVINLLIANHPLIMTWHKYGNGP